MNKIAKLCATKSVRGKVQSLKNLLAVSTAIGFLSFSPVVCAQSGMSLDEVLSQATNGTPPKQDDTTTLEELERKSLIGISSKHFDSQNGTPTFLKFKFPPIATGKGSLDAGDYIATAKGFLADYKELLNLENPASEMEFGDASLDRQGRRHVRFRQTYDGLNVWGKEAMVHMDHQGSVYLFSGRYTPSVKSLDTSPTIPQSQALLRVEEDLKSKGFELTEVEKLIYPSDVGPKLAYRLNVSKGFDERWDYFVDAHNGQILDRITNILDLEFVQAQGKDAQNVQREFVAATDGHVYAMFGPLETSAANLSAQKSITTLSKGLPPNSLKDGFFIYSTFGEGFITPERLDDRYVVMAKQKDTGWDPIAVSALHNTNITYDYYKRVFGRKSLDGKGIRLVSIVHVGNNFDNAFWHPGLNIMVYGDGGTHFEPLAKCLDVAAHEMTHGVTSFTANLIYQGQSGALNESFSDVFAAMVDREDWLVGEDCTRAKPGYLRNLEKPHNTGQPMKMSEYKNLANNRDHGGVHTNSGIPNYAGYLTATAIGREKTEQIYYQALTSYLSPSSQFIDARRALIQAAEDLYGANSREVGAVTRAWDKVEVFDSKNSSQEYTPTSQNQYPSNQLREELERLLTK